MMNIWWTVLAVILLDSNFFFFVSAGIQNDQAVKVAVDMTTFAADQIATWKITDSSYVQCAALSSSNPNFATFCVTSARECILVDKTFPIFYDDNSGGVGGDCYTYEKPAFDLGKTVWLCLYILV